MRVKMRSTKLLLTAITATLCKVGQPRVACTMMQAKTVSHARVYCKTTSSVGAIVPSGHHRARNRPYRPRERAHASALCPGVPDPQAYVSCVDSCHAWTRLAEASTSYSASTPSSATKRWQSMNEVLCRHCARRCSLQQPLLNTV